MVALAPILCFREKGAENSLTKDLALVEHSGALGIGEIVHCPPVFGYKYSSWFQTYQPKVHASTLWQEDLSPSSITRSLC